MMAETKLAEDLEQKGQISRRTVKRLSVQMKDQGRFHEHKTLANSLSATKLSSSVRYAHDFRLCHRLSAAYEARLFIPFGLM